VIIKILNHAQFSIVSPKPLWIAEVEFSQARCSYWCPANNVKVLKAFCC